MGNRNNIQKVLPTEKFVDAVEQDLYFQVNFDDTSRNLIQGDRSVDINLDERFNEERQSFTEYRVYGKIMPIVDNCFDGLAIDTTPGISLSAAFSTLLFQDLYYTQPAASPWHGYPQFNEFDFKRNDVDETVSTKTNWSMYVTYPSECEMDEDMFFQLDKTGMDSISYIASDGIAFYVTNVTEGGRNLTRFTCSSPHGLKKREFVEITIDGGTSYQTFPILNFGDGTRNSKDNVFNLSITVGTYFVGTTTQINDNIMGTMKRVINPNISNSKSRYYVRQNKVLTKLSDYVLDNCGFEEGVFPDVKQVDRITPLAQCRVSVKKSYPAYLYNFTKDVDVERLRDNLGRPLTTLFVSVLLKNDLGYFNYPPNRGWEWNFPYSFIDNSVSGVFVRGTGADLQPVSGSIVDVIAGSALLRGRELSVGDTLRGDFCEYNEYEITERVVDGIVHRFDWNPQVFSHTGQTTSDGYIYKPHYDVPIRVFSNYIEYGDPQEVTDVPEWAEYWEPTKEWRWRDLWEIGFFDEGNGVDYPFLNGKQYPKRIIKFYVQRQNRSLSDTTGNDGSDIIDELIIDGCE
jgi:hypothetical protein